MGWTNGPYLRNFKKMMSAPRTNCRANLIEPIIEWANALVPPTPFKGADIYISYICIIICLYSFRLRFSHLNQSMKSCSTKLCRIWGHSRALSHVAGLNALYNRGQWPECLLEAAAQRLRHLRPGKRHA